MTVIQFDLNRPRRPRKPAEDEVRDLLADMVAHAYADDLTVDDREAKLRVTVRKAMQVLTRQEIDAADVRLFGPVEAS